MQSQKGLATHTQHFNFKNYAILTFERYYTNIRGAKKILKIEMSAICLQRRLPSDQHLFSCVFRFWVQ